MVMGGRHPSSDELGDGSESCAPTGGAPDHLGEGSGAGAACQLAACNWGRLQLGQRKGVWPQLVAPQITAAAPCRGGGLGLWLQDEPTESQPKIQLTILQQKIQLTILSD